MSYRDETVRLRQKLDLLEASEGEARRSAEHADELACAAERQELAVKKSIARENFARAVRSALVGVGVMMSTFAVTYLVDREAPELTFRSWTDALGTEHAEPCTAKIDDAFFGLSALRVVCGSRVVFEGPVDANLGGEEYWHHGDPSVVWSTRHRRIIVRRSGDIIMLSMDDFQDE